MAAGRPFITANQVTLARIACIPLPCWLLYQGKTGQLLAVILGTLIAVTDMLDGYLARKYGSSVLGQLMDPIADKVYVATAYYVTLSLLHLPWWWVAAVLLREFLVTALRTLYESRGLSLKSSYVSRYKNWVQLCAVGLLFLWEFDTQAVLVPLLWFAAIAPIVGAVLVKLIRKKTWKGANWFAVSFTVVAVVNQFMVPWRYNILLVFTLGLTWWSGIEYFLGVPKLLKNRFVSLDEWPRLAVALAVPIAIGWVLGPFGLGSWWLVAVVAIEVAHAGLDGLLAHHQVASPGWQWGLRGTVVVGLALAVAFVPQEQRRLIAALAFLVSAGSFAGAMIRHRKLYLEPKILPVPPEPPAPPPGEQGAGSPVSGQDST